MSDGEIVIIGAGLGGLVCGALLAKEGCKVTLVEKNPRPGGCLQSYLRDGSVFDTGMHIFGGMAPHGNMRRIFDHLGISSSLMVRDLDSCKDIEVYIGRSDERIPMPLNRTSFLAAMGDLFPEERTGLERYLAKIDGMMDSLDLFNLRSGTDMLPDRDPDILRPADAFIAKYIHDDRLRSLLASVNILYAGEKGVTPAYLHAAITSIFLNAACRVVGGYETLARALVKVIEDNGGQIFTDSRVEKIMTDGTKALSVTTARGLEIPGQTFILASPLTALPALVDDSRLISRGYRSYLSSREDSLSSFIVNLKLKPGKISYTDSIGIYLEDYSSVWNDASDGHLERFMYMTPPFAGQGEFADTLNVVAPFRWSAVSKWKDTLTGKRGEEYMTFKRHLVETVLQKLSRIYPDIAEAVEYQDSATPLTIRDFTGVRHGAMCGLRKDCHDPLPFIPLHTRIPNLLLTGQSVNMHGFCGVTLTALQTCEAILGRNYLINKIK